MISEAKFRGKRLDNGGWVYGDLLTEYPYHNGATIVEHGCIYHEVDPATVGQFTGLHDKKGKEIYRGHILKYTRIIYTDCSQTEIEEIAEPGLIELIQYHPMASIIKPLTDNVKAFGWDQETGEALVVNLTSEEVEIVGNICENSELLESLKGGDIS